MIKRYTKYERYRTIRSGVITGRATAGIKNTQQEILSFVLRQGRHGSWISVKFGTAEREIWHGVGDR